MSFDPSSRTEPPTHMAATWVIRIAILFHALGLARALYNRSGTSIGSIALLHWKVPHEMILFWEKAGGSLLVLLAVSLFIRPTMFALLGVFALVFTESLAAVKAGGFAFFAWTPYANVLRYLAPLALLPLVMGHHRIALQPEDRRSISSWILRIGLAVVFVTHGIEALKLHPGFIDLIIGSGRSLFGWSISENAAGNSLRVIFVVDLIVAGLILIRTWTPLLAWMALWGLATALSRSISLGFESYPEILLRASHFLAPLAIWLLRRADEKNGTESLEKINSRGESMPPKI
jgi:uncharacterized membrane protein YphA (DoxX/SURF4 family)